MRQAVTISLPEELKDTLDKISEEEGVSRSDVVQDSLRDYVFMRQFQKLRARLIAKAQAQGVYTDEDVFERVS